MPLPLAFGSLILGGLQAGISAVALNRLNQTPTPVSSITPEMQNSYGRAESRAGYGYSPEQRSDYFNNVAGRYSQGVLNANKMGGGQISNAFGRAFQSSSLDDFSRFAANDAQLQQQNIRYADSRGDVISNQKDQIIGQQRQDRQMKEQAFGGALSSGLNNIASAANFFGMNGGFDGMFKNPNGMQSDGVTRSSSSFDIPSTNPLFNTPDATSQTNIPYNGPMSQTYQPAWQPGGFNGTQNWTGWPQQAPMIPGSGPGMQGTPPAFGQPYVPGGLGQDFYQGGYSPQDAGVFNDPGYGGNVTRYNPWGGLYQNGRRN